MHKSVSSNNKLIKNEIFTQFIKLMKSTVSKTITQLWFIRAIRVVTVINYFKVRGYSWLIKHP